MCASPKSRSPGWLPCWLPVARVLIASLSGCRRSGSVGGLAAVTWAYARCTLLGYLTVSCVYTCGPRRSRAVVGAIPRGRGLLTRRQARGLQDVLRQSVSSSSHSRRTVRTATSSSLPMIGPPRMMTPLSTRLSKNAACLPRVVAHGFRGRGPSSAPLAVMTANTGMVHRFLSMTGCGWLTFATYRWYHNRVQTLLRAHN